MAKGIPLTGSQRDQLYLPGIGRRVGSGSDRRNGSFAPGLEPRAGQRQDLRGHRRTERPD